MNNSLFEVGNREKCDEIRKQIKSQGLWKICTWFIAE